MGPHARRIAARTPTDCQDSSGSIHRKQICIHSIVLAASLLPAILFYWWNAATYTCESPGEEYDVTYPLTKPRVLPGGFEYRIAVITDLDTDSETVGSDGKVSWVSYYMTGVLTLHANRTSSVTWDENRMLLSSKVAEDGRGMELSELIVFNGKLYAVDDKTGVVYNVKDERTSKKAVPWVILRDGDGEEVKGFKAEWAVVKDQLLYFGGLGQEWPSSNIGGAESMNHLWVKTVNARGVVRHLDWSDNYQAMRRHAGIEAPGYVTHKAAAWSDVHRRWFFLPWCAAAEPREVNADEQRATNLLITADETFGDVQVRRLWPAHLTYGFTSFKFVPGTSDSQIVALATMKDGGQTATYIMTFDLDGQVLMNETLIGSYKFEGIEFV